MRAARRTAARTGRPPAVRAEVRLRAPSARAITVKHLDTPPRYARRERIHHRRVLPRIKEGQEREFHSTTREVAYHPQRALPVVRAATDDVRLVTNTELAQPGQQQLASSVTEPSVAANGQVVMYTGNWYAARSADGGQTFQGPLSFCSAPCVRTHRSG